MSAELTPPPLPLQVVDSLDVSPQGTRVGLVQYSSRVRTEFPLGKYGSAEEIKAAVMKVMRPRRRPAEAESDWRFWCRPRWSTWRRAP